MQSDPLNSDEENSILKRKELQEILFGHRLAKITAKRMIVSFMVGVVVGFVEAGIIPKTKQQFLILLLFIGIRIATAITYSLVPWKILFLLKGMVISVIFTLPLLAFTQPMKYPQFLFIACLSGIIISYGIERISQSSSS
ncbi:MAG: hypothetical protein N2450_03270 [bacterium]|nr:hypothetical protein [bacterium]